MEPIIIIDGIAPFFVPYCDGSRQNWSKAPLHRLVNGGQVDPEAARIILDAFRHYCQRARAIGCTAVTVDDLAHLTLFDFYPYLISRTVFSYQKLFSKLIVIAQENGLELYVTTDCMFWNRSIESATRGRENAVRSLFAESISRLFDMFPAVAGVVIRIGESDGVEVDSLFKSRLWIRTAKQGNRWLREILPLAESAGKKIIFRTWGLGAFPVGDLIWNESTEQKLFAGIESTALIVSRKYGNADYFRYLELNDRIRTSRLPQIVEFQARREYEGFGEFPAYVGWHYEQIRDQLHDIPSICGISIWAQTGGWSHFDRLTLLKNGSIWNELNLIATVQLFTTHRSADEILHRTIAKLFPRNDRDTIRLIVQVTDRIIEELWYFKPFAKQTLWFRRLRVPPLLWIFWDTILVNPAIRLVIRAFIGNCRELRERDRELRKELTLLKQLAGMLSTPTPSISESYRTFRLIYTIRGYYLGKTRHDKIIRRIERYQTTAPRGFQVEYDFSPIRLRWITEGFLFGLLLRKKSRYRHFDRWILIPLTGWLFPVIKKYHFHKIPELASRQAVGMELFFR